MNNITFGNIKKNLLILKKEVKIDYLEDLIFYHKLNSFIPEIEINENLEIIAKEKGYVISNYLENVEFLNVVIFGNTKTSRFKELEENGLFHRRDIKKILDQDKTKNKISWECYKFKNVLKENVLKSLESDLIDFYNQLNHQNILNNFFFKKEINTFYFKLDLHEVNYYLDKQIHFIKKIIKKYGDLILINGIPHERYLERNW